MSATVRTRILTGFIIVLAIGMVLGAAGIISINVLRSMSNQQDEMQIASDRISQVLIAHYNWRQTLTEAVLNESDFTGSLDPTTCALGSFLNSAEAQSIKDTEALNLLEQVKTPHAYIHTEAAKIQEFISAKNIDEAIRYFNEYVSPTTAEVIAGLTAIDQRYGVLLDEHGKKISNIQNIMMIIIIALIVTALAAGIMIALLISAGIEKSLKNIIGNIKSSTTDINSEVTTLKEASDSLAESSSRQAAAIEQTSATMNETESMVAQNAENTRIAAQLAADANDMAHKGMTEMQNMMKSMEEIKESSDKVGRIVKTIDDIAFQTNLLAINATVEAARAGGDAGRSFGVVAEEVRNLAQKSKSAAADTTSIIERNIQLTGSGRAVSHAVSVSLKKITEKAEQLNRLIVEINAASEEQASGIKQINVAITQMESVTQANAAVAEETSATSNSLKSQAGTLEETISDAMKLIKKT